MHFAFCTSISILFPPLPFSFPLLPHPTQNPRALTTYVAGGDGSSTGSDDDLSAFLLEKSSSSLQDCGCSPGEEDARRRRRRAARRAAAATTGGPSNGHGNETDDDEEDDDDDDDDELHEGGEKVSMIASIAEAGSNNLSGWKNKLSLGSKCLFCGGGYIILFFIFYHVIRCFLLSLSLALLPTKRIFRFFLSYLLFFLFFVVSFSFAFSPVYLGMGWAALVVVPDLLERLPGPAIRLLIAGGLAYT